MKFFNKFIFRSPLFSTKQVVEMNYFNEALYLSSPILYEEYKKTISNIISDKKEVDKINISLHKYKTRASERCTPFGLFAGLGIGTWGDENSIRVDADLKLSLSRKTRLDMNVLFSLSQELSKQIYIRPYLKFYPNSSLYLIGNNYRYIEYYYNKNRRYHKINKVDHSDHLQYILTESKTGLTQSEISELLINDDISYEEASEFVNELIISQLLTSQIEPTLTGTDYFDFLLGSIKKIQLINPSENLGDMISLLIQIDYSIKDIDDAIFNPIESYKEIYYKLKKILPELVETNLFQTDLYKKTNEKVDHNNKLSVELQDRLKKTVQFLNKISPPTFLGNMDSFKKRFQEHYDGDEVPLLIALDSETGVGYPAKDTLGVNELVDDIIVTLNSSTENDIKWNSLQANLLKLIVDSLKANKTVIEITENDFNGVDYSVGTLPDSYCIMFKVLNSNSNRIEMGNIGGSSAVNLLGRFAGGNKELADIIENITEFEQNQMADKILAEIVHLPESRTGNILARPSFRRYEIPYLAKSSVEDHFQIRMADLTIKLRNNKIILFDKRLKKEIIPRMGNAHNYSFNSLPVYHFLCDLQIQYFNKPFIGFNWGVLASQFEFLPRVEYDNVVLSSAKWQLTYKDLAPLQDKRKSSNEKEMSFFELKERIKLHDIFLIADGDNELLIDCTNPIAIKTFIDSVKNRNSLVLEEYLFASEHSLIRDSNGNSFANECLAIVLNEKDLELDSSFIDTPTYKSQQVFAIGGEWLYYKIYCGAKTADYILTDKIRNITSQLLNDGCIDHWYFIRYADPDIHIRFRLHFSDLKKIGVALQLINYELQPLLNQHIISKLQTDTYKRELERYGDSSIELAEKLFHSDSVFITNMLAMVDAGTGSSLRWKIAIRSVDSFLNDFKLTQIEKYNLIDKLKQDFFNEHGGAKELKLLLDNKFRTLRVELEDFLNSDNDQDKEYYPVIDLINQRSFYNESITGEILKLKFTDKLQVNFNDLLSSLLHMNLDRLFMGRNRTNEFVVYDLLFRYYKSSLARLDVKINNATMKKANLKI